MACVAWWCVVVCVVVTPCHAWDNKEMELFDVVEEINENFYTVMGISQDATLQEVKKAYRKLSLQLHPDKNDADDAEVKFRQLVSVYDVLRDEAQRARYNQVLVEGLPDWRSPIYYYRRARKMSLLEIAIILTVVISLTQYLMAWGTYIDTRQCVEEALVKKYKIKDRKKKKPEDIENILLMEEELSQIPRPSWWNILPVQLVRLTIFLVTGGPTLVREYLAYAREEKRRREREKEEEEEEERRIQEEEEKKEKKKASRKEGRKRVNLLPDFTNSECILDSVDAPDEQPRMRPAAPAPPVVSGGFWTDEDFNDLTKLMAKYPGGTQNRWERIAEMMGRTVFEVTKMSYKIKSSLTQRSNEPEGEEVNPEAKVKVKTKGDKGDLSAGCDEAWSVVQQKALEKALKQCPKGTDQRWDKISRTVPDKTKEECMLRFKFLAEKIRRKKTEESGRREEEEEGGEKPPQSEKSEDDETTTTTTTTKTTTSKRKNRIRRRDIHESEEEEEEDTDDDDDDLQE